MSGSAVRINQDTHKLLKELSDKTGKPMQLVLCDAVEDYRRKCFFEEMNSSFAAVKNDFNAWVELKKESDEWEQTTADGQDDES